MSLVVGTRLGPYEIVAPLGAGGMGEVYKARDTRLDRTVAIKVLPDSLAADPEFRARLEREARTVSALNHPHICALYDIGQQDGVDYLVMEYLDGETLAARVTKGPLPVDQVLRFALHMSDALDKAHRAGIVHRDLKPGNIMITKAGAKLLDFGLAKATPKTAFGAMSAPQQASALPTAPANLTAHGTILGTFQYMAPEQLEGKEADARTDLFALGAVLYEMVTAKKAFEGNSTASLVSAIMSAEPPPLATCQPLTPPALDRLIRTCLAKDPEDRFHTAHDLLLQLRWIAEGGSQVGVAVPVAARRKHRERLAWSVAAVSLMGLVVLLVSGSLGLRQDRLLAPIRLSWVPPDDTLVPQVAISPDGRRLAFTGEALDGQSMVWIRSLDSPDAQPLKGTQMGYGPFWSPDGRFVAFFAQGKLKRMEVPDGSPQTICDAPSGLGGTWGADGTIVFLPIWGQPLLRVSAAGGTPVPATKIDTAKEASHVVPHFLPDGRHFLYFVRSAQREIQGVYVASLDSTAGTRLLAADSGAAYAEPGFLLYAREGALVAQPFDTKRLTVSGEATTVTPRVQFNEADNEALFTVSRDRRLVYRVAALFRSRLVWIDAAGKESASIAADTGGRVSLSPDEKRVAIDREDAQTAATDVWLLDLSRGIPSKFSSSPTSDNSAVWSPEGSRLVFASDQGAAGFYHLFEKPWTGGAEVAVLTSDADKHPTDWSRDGRFILYDTNSKTTKLDLWVLPLTGDRVPVPFVQAPFRESQGRFSPDTRWIAYVSDESGQEEVYVQPFPPTGATWQVSVGGGNSPRWGGDARELFYVGKDRTLRSVAIAPQPTFDASAPTALFSLRNATDYAVSREGRRFLVNLPVSDPRSSPLTVVLNWTGTN